MQAYLNECEWLCPDCAGDDTEEVNWYDLDYEESDVPQNCAVCHRPLGGALTPNGIKYILDAIQESLRVGRQARNTIHDCYKGTYYEGSRHCEIVRDWAEQIRHSVQGQEEALVRRYLSWTEKKKFKF